MSGEAHSDRGEVAERPGWTPLEGPLLDGLVTGLAVVMVAGIALDFRSHAAGLSFAEEGFLTPEHALFYSMFLAIGTVVGAATYRNRLAGADWYAAVPAGYEWGALGLLLFGFGGVADFGWHSTFGFEESVEALTSPSHLLLATGAVLFLASPLRATIRRDDDPTGPALVPALLSASLVVSIFALFTAYVNPIVQYTAGGYGVTRPGADIAAFIVFPALLVGSGLALARRFDLPVGGLALVFLVPALASATPTGRFQLVVPAVVAGLVGDAVVRWRRPTAANPRALRVFGAAVGAAVAAGHLVTLAVTDTIDPGWSVHAWAGLVVLAGATGLLLTYVVVPDGTVRVDG